MARVIDTDNIFTSEAVTNETTVTEGVSVEHLSMVAIWADWTGSTITGSAKLQASVDNENWVDVDGSDVTITAADSYLWNHYKTGFRYIRLSVTSDDANTITVTAKVSGKG